MFFEIYISNLHVSAFVHFYDQIDCFLTGNTVHLLYWVLLLCVYKISRFFLNFKTEYYTK